MTNARSLIRFALFFLAIMVHMSPQVNAKSSVIIKKGKCTGASTYKLKLSPENGKVEVEFEVDQNKNGVNWDVKFFRNDVQFASGTYTTAAPSGSFSAEKLSSFRSGTFKVVATRTGETCTASAAASF
ncbi:hypothetical protein MHU86_17272 [Fragilaria crotonensis]|nr:hypothetical protein MHU86_19177 [Fragilaria crotonensis]KAI2497225.1 hypothetical protein MHU86_17272 [Fragilaria crotonensis]